MCVFWRKVGHSKLCVFLLSKSGIEILFQALALMEEKMKSGSYLSTSLPGLDNALCGGIPFGALTELVGPSGIGKTQVSSNFCECAHACFANSYGLIGRKIYFVGLELLFLDKVGVSLSLQNPFIHQMFLINERKI